MHLGSIYLIVNDFARSVDFYEKLLEMPVTATNKTRFAQFQFEGHNISLMNGHYDAGHPEVMTHRGNGDVTPDDMRQRALAVNTHKFVLNFWHEDLRAEHGRLRGLSITEHITPVCSVSSGGDPYYYFQLTDPDGNILEVTGDYQLEAGEFDAR